MATDAHSLVVTTSVEIRPAFPADLPAAMNVLDGAMLDVAAGTVRERLTDESVLVAVDDDRVLGALVARRQGNGAFVEAVAVRRARRDRGIGRALVAEAADRFGPLTAEFDAAVRPFYASLGFAIAPVDDERFRGRYDGP